MNTGLIRYGLVLILVALVGGFFIPGMAIPRLGLSAHTIGVMSGILLMLLGVIWSQFELSAGKLSVMKWAWIYSSYANWLGCLLGALFGAGKTTPVAAAGVIGPELAELAVLLLLGTVGLTSLLAVMMALVGLRSR